LMFSARQTFGHAFVRKVVAPKLLEINVYLQQFMCLKKVEKQNLTSISQHFANIKKTKQNKKYI